MIRLGTWATVVAGAVNGRATFPPRTQEQAPKQTVDRPSSHPSTARATAVDPPAQRAVVEEPPATRRSAAAHRAESSRTVCRRAARTGGCRA
jgi:hypothetical protein